VRKRLAITLVASLLATSSLLAKDADAQARPRPVSDACKLLSAAELKRVQHTVLQDTKASVMQSGADITMRQCFYRGATHADSVSLLLAEPSKRPSSVVREYWESTLVKAAHTEVPASENGEMTKGQAKKQRHKPEPVAGLGEQAWWVGDRNTGALYVLLGDRFFRISVGGPPDQTADKKARMTALAKLILKRL
jgi:hypothetical protein